MASNQVLEITLQDFTVRAVVQGFAGDVGMGPAVGVTKSLDGHLLKIDGGETLVHYDLRSQRRVAATPIIHRNYTRCLGAGEASSALVVSNVREEILMSWDIDLLVVSELKRGIPPDL